MFNDDSLQKLRCNSAVPHAFRINDNDRATSTHAQAGSLSALYACGAKEKVLTLE